MAEINWRMIAFWAALWWFVYSAPTEDPFDNIRAQWISPTAEYAEDFD